MSPDGEVACPSCGGAVSSEVRFCRHCGLRLRIGPAAAADPVERKLVTALAVDVQGSVRLSERVEAEKWHRIIGRFFGLLAQGVRRFEGTVSRFTGDGIVAVFGAPVAQEDHARRACHAALHLIGELQEYAADLRRNHGIQFTVRLGVHSDLAVVATSGPVATDGTTVLGEAILIATAAEQLAEPGKIYVTSQTAQLLGADFVLRDLGRLRSARLERDLEVSELVQESTRGRERVIRGADTPMVGRDRELARLGEALSASGSNGRVVGVIGEGGVGKSRLCEEFLARCEARGLAVQHWYALPHHRSVPFRALRDSIARFFGVAEGSSMEDTLETLRPILADGEGGEDALVPVVLELLGRNDGESVENAGEANQRGLELAGLLETLVVASETRLPDVMLIEDLHWVDAPSRAILERFVRLVPQTRVLLILNHRPDPSLTEPEDSILLGPLDESSATRLLEEMLGPHRSVEPLANDIRERTGGNPFFLRETVRALADDGTLVGRTGAYRLQGEIDSTHLPATVHAALAARIDALADRDKEVLRAAAVVGQRFSVQQVSETTNESDRTVSRALAALERANFIRSGSPSGQEWYEFEHPIVAEAARRSLFGSKRRALQRAAAAAGGGR